MARKRMLAGFAVIVGQKEIREACESSLKHPLAVVGKSFDTVKPPTWASPIRVQHNPFVLITVAAAAVGGINQR
jgi:hypothetical protein